MGLSDCVYCWNTPCTCGAAYMAWPEEEVYQHVLMLIEVLVIRDGGLKAVLDRVVEKAKGRSCGV